jgi:hypothetical protein
MPREKFVLLLAVHRLGVLPRERLTDDLHLVGVELDDHPAVGVVAP